jgi:sulfur-oxidizing protein SoxZ
MSDQIRIRARHRKGETKVMVLALHPMETGMRTGTDGDIVPAHYITKMTVTAAGRVVLEARMSIAVAKDPLVSFRFRGGTPGDEIHVTWVDNRGQQASGTGAIV